MINSDVQERRIEALRQAMLLASDRLNPSRTDPIAARLYLLRAILADDDVVSALPDHRTCKCGHYGSVHDPAPNAPTTTLGYAIKGVGSCRGSTDADKRCTCKRFR